MEDKHRIKKDVTEVINFIRTFTFHAALALLYLFAFGLLSFSIIILLAVNWKHADSVSQ